MPAPSPVLQWSLLHPPSQNRPECFYLPRLPPSPWSRGCCILTPIIHSCAQSCKYDRPSHICPPRPIFPCPCILLQRSPSSGSQTSISAISQLFPQLFLSRQMSLPEVSLTLGAPHTTALERAIDLARQKRLCINIPNLERLHLCLHSLHPPSPGALQPVLE